MDFGLTDKIVVITGATANIGKATALDFATEGAKVLVCGRDSGAGQKVVEEALARGAANAEFFQADMLESDQIKALADQVKKTYGKVDVLINNVGGNFDSGAFIDSDPTLWQKDIDISLTTTLGMTHAFLPLMKDQGWGRIVNLGSTAGSVGDCFLSVYSAAKGAVAAFTRVLAKEVGAFGITVNCVAPYATQSSNPDDFSSGSRWHPESGFFTKMTSKMTEKDISRMMRSSPLNRPMATPEEVSAMVVFLSSERASYITGETIHVAGGSLL